MSNKRHWRRGFGLAQIMALIIVVIPTAAFMITLLFDYWTAMQLDNRLKLMSHRAIMAINNAETLGAAYTLPEADREIVESLCPASMRALVFARMDDMPSAQTRITAQVMYDRFNHLEAKVLSSTITSYSYNDQNGSYLLECK
ncbi:MAG: hypothetical protein JXK04_01235 [Campylobacterales bacterium]|nr:hypothetical protein [Campylobacterales bacterium]